MGMNSKPGSDTYDKILQSYRSDHKPIGVQYQLHNKQLKKWEARQSNLRTLEKARTVKKQKAETRAVKKELNSIRERVQAVSQAEQEAEGLRKKFNDFNRAKIAQGYKTPEFQSAGDRIKSVGNGL